MRRGHLLLALSIACIAGVLPGCQRWVHGGGSAAVAPYTAYQTITRHQKTSDGLPLDTVTIDERARDRQGRTYQKTERELRNGDQTTRSYSFFVEDPVKLRTLSWNSNGKTVTVGHWPYWKGRKGCWADEHGLSQVSFAADDDFHKIPASPADGKVETIGSIADPSGKRIKARFTLENLGSREIRGLAAYGTRSTVTPLEDDGWSTWTTEIWKSSEFDLKLLEVVSGPEFGLRRLELTDLQRGDPDPSLFDPPQGYKVDATEYHQVTCQQN